LMADAFGPGINGPLLVVVDRSKASDNQALLKLMREVENDARVRKIYPDPSVVTSLDNIGRFLECFANANEKGTLGKEKISENCKAKGQGDVYPFVVYLKAAPQSQETLDFVHNLRNNVAE